MTEWSRDEGWSKDDRRMTSGGYLQDLPANLHINVERTGRVSHTACLIFLGFESNFRARVSPQAGK